MVRVNFPTADSSTSAAPERSKQGSSLNGIDCSDGQQEPIDVLEVDGKYYGFSGCHRFEACQRLGKTISQSQGSSLFLNAPCLSEEGRRIPKAYNCINQN